jgi:uncharacterized protein
MSQANIETVQAAYDAFRRGDTRAVFDLLHPEVEVYQSSDVPGGGSYRGHEQVGQFFAKLAQSIRSNVESDRFIDAGDHIVQVGHTRGRAQRTGKEFDVPEVHVWTLENGKVIRFEAYIDNPKMLAALESRSGFAADKEF